MDPATATSGRVPAAAVRAMLAAPAQVAIGPVDVAAARRCEARLACRPPAAASATKGVHEPLGDGGRVAAVARVVLVVEVRLTMFVIRVVF